jgi:hypothetical protein
MRGPRHPRIPQPPKERSSVRSGSRSSQCGALARPSWDSTPLPSPISSLPASDVTNAVGLLLPRTAELLPDRFHDNDESPAVAGLPHCMPSPARDYLLRDPG